MSSKITTPKFKGYQHFDLLVWLVLFVSYLIATGVAWLLFHV